MEAIQAVCKKILWLMLLCVCSSTYATELPSLHSKDEVSPHKFFMYSDTQTNSEQFEVWTIDSGYSYSIHESLDIYIGARLDNAESSTNNGFLSGVSYKVSERVSVKSSLRGYQYEDKETTHDGMAAEISSRVKISDNLDVHATFDFHKIQQGVEVGLGFRF
ncbi:outer membrane protein [Vibrio hippocampi]|uniref:Uncharacterized protein n=1 Tax=Vibrio hippocampi TaxID=654686 RepID=A0ABM8ZJH6_9VIBR|nr:ribonuclease regulator [Vibrio hippocampi]CAH0527050.1 hypothetical protein VHP8226_02391 [Vibrio hippocampi]